MPHKSRALKVLALTLVFVMTFTTTGVALAYNRFQSNIDRHNLDDLIGTDRPTVAEPAESAEPADAHAGETLNVLVLGSDSRDGDNADVGGFGAFEGMRADTALIIQIPADRSSLTVVSIPRDTLVDIPACVRPDGTTSAPQQDAMFNSAFSTGAQDESLAYGAACTIKTVEALTGVLIDDFVVVDFAGFINIVDALDGIPMYVPEDVYDVDAGLDLLEGCQILNGHDALGFARVRKTVGDGSDISRIGRQQDLLLAVLRDVLSSHVLSNPVRLYSVVDQATQTITSGEKIGTLTELIGLATSMRNLDLDEVHFITMPFDWAGARVVPNELYAEQVWEALRTGQPVDQRLTGAGWEIAERIAADEAAAQATEEPSDAATDTPTDDATDEPTAAPTDTPTIAPTEEETDPAANCTRETARQ